MNSIVKYDELKELVGGSSPASTAAKLQQKGIKHHVGNRGRPFTTITAIEQAMGVRKNTRSVIDEDQPRRIELS